MNLRRRARQRQSQTIRLAEFAEENGIISDDDFKICVKDDEFFLVILSEKEKNLHEKLPVEIGRASCRERV